ncbi:PAN domain-containing protein [Litorimonas taeanensis]|uniref:PAN domain-containing protein n=1 Tax=Litorimonas taeanensis TaxID=568099 RepID=A0A420WEA0_9PROT|nr:PAN/Apple domain-containing protein [Litorimonas taeanensis]RKQ69347.1 PAN domain-containing protein [Litorimonas taeanensis]
MILLKRTLKCMALPLATIIMGFGATAQAQSYNKTPNAAISGHNKAKIKGSVLDCQTACNSRTDFVCTSFDYNKADQSCDLSDQNTESVKLKTDYKNHPYDYYEKAQVMPDLTTAWDSSEGLIYWLGGYYQTPDKTLKGTLERHKAGYKFVGKWGRMDSQRGIVPKGDVTLVFSEKGKSFTGTYEKESGALGNWTGSYKSNAPYSLGVVPPHASQNSQYNAQLAFQIKASDSDNGVEFETYEQSISPTNRCDAEMIAFFKKQGLSNPSITKVCRN